MFSCGSHVNPFGDWCVEALCREREARQKVEVKLAEKTNEIARLRELLPTDDTYTRQLENELEETDNEVARLRSCLAESERQFQEQVAQVIVEMDRRIEAEGQVARLMELLERALVVEAMTISGTWEQRAIRDQYDLLKHSSGGAL
jgi:septal ring factor EnvC (AmiA/AmiB activator)